MDIAAALSDHEQSNPETPSKPEASKMVFVSPGSEHSPDDGVLTYSTIEKLFDVASVPDRSVILFRADQMAMLKCICENSVLFDVEIRSLTGVPETEYSAEYEELTWALDKVAYLPFISELRLELEMSEQLKAQAETAYDRERATYTRKSGEVKAHSKFEVVTPTEGESTTSDDEEVT